MPAGQWYAAYALGLTPANALRLVIVPQAIRLILPPLTNDFIALLKDSSLVSALTMLELTGAYNRLATETFDYFGTGLLVAFLCLLLGLPLCAPRTFNGGTPRQGTSKSDYPSIRLCASRSLRASKYL